MALHRHELETRLKESERRFATTLTGNDAEDRLRHAHKLEAVGRLAGGIAHDFNNLMTVVIGYGDMALAQLADQHPLRALIQAMKDAGDRAAVITRQLLAFGRKQTLTPVVLNVNDVVRAMEEVLRCVLGEDVTIVSRLQPELANVHMDRGQLEQVIVNLAINARDAMPQGGTLTLETTSALLDEQQAGAALEVQPGRYVVLAVSDTGCGMDPDTQAHLFEPFFRTKDVGRGNGLGLATVYGIVKQSGGHIFVSRRPGQGATFQVCLPEIAAPATPAAAVQAPAVAAGAETILLVEDSDQVRSLTRSILLQNGYTVIEAGDGAEALRLCADEPRPIDLLLTDAIMPHLSGRALAQQLTATHPGLKVLYMSGHTEDHILRHGVLTAEMAFLQKPFSVSELTGRVREVLDQQ